MVKRPLGTAGTLNDESSEALTHPATKRSPCGDAGAQVPQDADDDDTGAQPVGPGLGTQAGRGQEEDKEPYPKTKTSVSINKRCISKQKK